MNKRQLTIESDIRMEHKDGTVTLKNNGEGQLVLDIPSKGLFNEMTSYPYGKGKFSSIKDLHESFRERGVELVVNVDDKHVLRLGREKEPYINYLYLAGNFFTKFTGSKDKP
ncbi:MAG: hypothetical protein WBB45_06685 [Cyclobacteriaceae bacterium]